MPKQSPLEIAELVTVYLPQAQTSNEATQILMAAFKHLQNLHFAHKSENLESATNKIIIIIDSYAIMNQLYQQSGQIKIIDGI